ncbi:MAG: YgjV family protein [Clostridia bacterium]|nr:YgjV family protein [Clostridia bacterium]
MQSFITLFGHFLGFIAVGLFFYSYQRTQKSKIVIIQTVATALSVIQYLLIGAFSGFALNLVCIIRNVIFYHRDKNQRSGWLSPILLSLCIGVASIFSWEGVHSLLITLGLVINTICMGVLDAKAFRKTILITSSLILIYNVFASSYSGILSESISLISVIIGIIRYRSTQQAPQPAKAVPAPKTTLAA